MRTDIAIAALSAEGEQRIRIAASLLAAHSIQAKVRSWDGTRCGLLVIAAEDAYGRQAAVLARKRGTPILTLGAESVSAEREAARPANSSSQTLMHALLELLSSTSKSLPASTSHEVQVRKTNGSALVALCTDAYRGKPVMATLDQRRIYLRPAEGRIFGQSLSDLLFACDSLHREGWQLKPVDENDTQFRRFETSRSLDAFLLQAAVHGQDRLPPFPNGNYRLKEWPDIGSAPQPAGALTMAGLLLRGGAGADQLANRSHLKATEANAVLWAYRASNILDNATESSAPQPTMHRPVAPVAPNLLSRIARRFGLFAS